MPNKEHPSYGYIHLQRLSGGDSQPLVGSLFSTQTERIKLTVSKGVVVGGHYTGSDPLIELELTHAQFADLIGSTKGQSPCTLRFLTGQGYITAEASQDPFNRDTLRQMIMEDIDASVQTIIEEESKILNLLEEPLTPERLSELRTRIDALGEDYAASVPSLLKAFELRIQSLVVKAMTDIAAACKGREVKATMTISCDEDAKELPRVQPLAVDTKALVQEVLAPIEPEDDEAEPDVEAEEAEAIAEAASTPEPPPVQKPNGATKPVVTEYDF